MRGKKGNIEYYTGKPARIYKLRRMRMGLTEAQVADMLDIRLGMLCAVEDELIPPTEELRIKLNSLYGIG